MSSLTSHFTLALAGALLTALLPTDSSGQQACRTGRPATRSGSSCAPPRAGSPSSTASSSAEWPGVCVHASLPPLSPHSSHSIPRPSAPPPQSPFVRSPSPLALSLSGSPYLSVTAVSYHALLASVFIPLYLCLTSHFSHLTSPRDTPTSCLHTHPRPSSLYLYISTYSGSRTSDTIHWKIGLGIGIGIEDEYVADTTCPSVYLVYRACRKENASTSRVQYSWTSG